MDKWLIRSKSDKGIVVVLDSRIIQKRYGQRFLAVIPDCPVEIVGSPLGGRLPYLIDFLATPKKQKTRLR